MSPEELNEEEKKFIRDLSRYAEKVHGEKWKEAAERGLNIPEEGLVKKISQRLDTEPPTEDAIESLKEKGLVEICEVESEVDTSHREVTYRENEEGETERSIDHRSYIRGKRDKKKLGVPEIEELVEEAEKQ